MDARTRVIRTIYAIASELKMDEDSRRTAIYGITGRWSVRDCTNSELALIRDTLHQKAGDNKTASYKRMGKKVIAIYASMGWTDGGKPDYERINAWIAQQPYAQERTLWQLSYEQMQTAVNQAEQIQKTRTK